MAGVKTISVFLVQRPPARGGWKGDGGLRGGSGGELDSAQASELPDLGLPPIQGGNCHDGAEREGVWNLAVWAQHPSPTSAPQYQRSALLGLDSHPTLSCPPLTVWKPFPLALSLPSPSLRAPQRLSWVFLLPSGLV